MNTGRRRPLSLTYLRSFEAVARRLNFSEAADELHVTQSAVSRQVKALEDELGSALFVRGTRHVQITQDGQALLRVVEPWLARLDAGVRQIRSSRSRRRVNVTTFASFASLWLLPRIEEFQRAHPDIDIRVSAQDAVVELDDDPEIDLALRYCRPQHAQAGALRLFGETLSPVTSRRFLELSRRGEAPPFDSVADLGQHTLTEEDDHRDMGESLSWRHWLARQGEAQLQPRRWLYLNFTYQQVQAALAGQGVALARMALVVEALQRGELVEPFGATGRIDSPYAYWLLVTPASSARPEVREFCAWVERQALATREALDRLAAAPADGPAATGR